MNDKKIFSYLLIVAVIVALAFMGLSTLDYYSVDSANSSLKNGKNISGSNFNLTIYIGNSSGGVGDGGINASVTNMSIMWQLSNSTYAQQFSTWNGNISFVANYTYNNVTANQTIWGNNSNTSIGTTFFDTTALADGVYNVSVMIFNFSNAGFGDGGQKIINYSIFGNIIIDNTKPRVVINEPATSGVTYTYTSGNVTFNISVADLTMQTAANSVAYGLVIFEFDNASGDGFNTSGDGSGAPVNQSGYWSMGINVSALHAGRHTVIAHVNDTASNGSISNYNRTQIWTFDVNTPHNVTWMTTNNLALGFNTFDFVFNLSVINYTMAPINTVIFMFDNASKSVAQMNLSNHSNVNRGQYWNVSYNISRLPVGTHTVTAFVNDTLGNLNKTASITFTVNNTPQNVTWDASYSPGASAYHGSPEGQNYSYNNGTIYFNISIGNWSDPNAKPHGVILMFDNGTSQGFNVSNGTNVLAGQYWNFSWINVSMLAEGTHIVTVFVNDTWGNYNKTESITFNVDKTAPAITVTCTDSPTVGDTVTCTCAATDSLSGVSVGPFIGSTSSTSETTTASGTVPVTSSTCTATDRAGNVGTGTGSWTPVAASTGGSGASGGGGGQSSGVTGTFAKEVWTSINAGETAKVEVTNGAIGVTEVSFSVADTTYGAWLKVEKKESLPSDVASFSGKTYKTVEITESNIKKALTGTAKIEFKVTKVWLSENGLGKTDVAMHRYAEGKWNELKTTVGEDDGTSVYYTAETSGFSYFIIGQKSGAVAGPAKEAAAEKVAGEKAAAGEEAAGEEAAAGEEVVAGEGKGIWTWVIVVLVIIALIAIAFWLKKR